MTSDPEEIIAADPVFDGSLEVNSVYDVPDRGQSFDMTAAIFQCNFTH